MPHVFALMLTDTPNAAKCYESWVGFIKQAVEGPEEVESVAKRVKAKTLEVEDVAFEDICEVEQEQMRQRICEFAAGREVEAKL